ncbi:putative adhesin [Streptomyces sp. IBSNAI002]|uniref:putative adhesin n=1 Tax=Streptomyces sp. IBSNAI002 TaxID=3457500 RepID=UPI003FD1DC84
MTDLFLMAHGTAPSLGPRVRVPAGRSLAFYADPGTALSMTEVQLVVSGADGAPAPRVRSGVMVSNTQLFPVSDFELSTAYAHFSECKGELMTLPGAMWLCTNPSLCSGLRHVCGGVLGPDFAAYDRIHVLACRGGAESANSVLEALARETDCFLASNYAATRAHWGTLDQTHQARYLGFDGVLLWFQVHSSELRAAGAVGEFHRLLDFQTSMPKEYRDLLLGAGNDAWPWIKEFMDQLRTEQQALVDLERSFDATVWSALSEPGQRRALEVYRLWGPSYLDSVEDAITAAGLVVPGRLTL